MVPVLQATVSVTVNLAFGFWETVMGSIEETLKPQVFWAFTLKKKVLGIVPPSVPQEPLENNCEYVAGSGLEKVPEKPALVV